MEKANVAGDVNSSLDSKGHCLIEYTVDYWKEIYKRGIFLLRKYIFVAFRSIQALCTNNPIVSGTDR